MPEVLREVCPSCGRMMDSNRYICRFCERKPNSPMVLVADQPEFAPKHYNRDSRYDDICMYCSKLEPCKERVQSGRHCYCEIQCEDDVLVLALGGE